MSRRKRSIPLTGILDPTRLQAASQRMGSLDREFQQLQQQLDQIRQERQQAASEEADHPQWFPEDTLNTYTDQLDAIEFQSAQAIAAQLETLQLENNRLQSELWDQATNQVEQQSIHMQNVLDQQQTMLQSRVDQLRNSFIENQQKIDHRQEIAWQALQDAQGLFDDLSSKFDPEPQWQAALLDLQNQIAQTQSNLELGFEEAALIGAQMVLQDLSDLENRLDAYVEQRQYLINTIQNLAINVIELILQNQRVQAMDLQGELLAIELEVDFWADGQLRLLLRQAKGILHQVDQPPFYLELDEIDRLGDRLVEIQVRIPEVVFQARVQVLASQMRFNIAECVVAALRTQGYDLEFGEFVGRDMRNSYHLKLGNLAGSQVFVSVSPVDDDPLVQTLALEANEPETLSAHEVNQRAIELEAALNLFGLKVGQIEGPTPVFNQTVNPQQPGPASSRMQRASKEMLNTYQFAG